MFSDFTFLVLLLFVVLRVELFRLAGEGVTFAGEDSGSKPLSALRLGVA